MDKIHILDKQIAERVAAGEVVERPASVVKELIENAIDADASAISIEIREGGIALIRVTDNGSGMSRDDAALAVERFATSKIAREDDLRAIRTLGFRGEALPAIPSMAQLELLTRTKDGIEGTRVHGEIGNWRVEIVGAPIGTQVVVRNPFYNAPARREFLKAPMRETELVQKTLMQYALACPQIAFRLIVDGRENLVAPASSPLERNGTVWGREVVGEMIAVDYASVDLRVRGFVSRPSFACASREWQAVFVNGRPIRSGLLADAGATIRRTPAAATPSARSDSHRTRSATGGHECASAQSRSALLPTAHDLRRRDASGRKHTAQISNDVLQGRNGLVIRSISHLESLAREPRANYVAGTRRALGQIHNTYILAQTPDGMVIVDQHTAQEQISYERLAVATRDSRLEIGDSQVSSLRSLISNLQVLPREAELLSAHLDEYRALGIEIEPFGENTFRVNALPACAAMNANEFLTARLQEHVRYRALDGDALLDKLAAKAACLCAIKAGDALDPAQQQELLDELLTIYSPATCPHGRPAFIGLRLEELERRFLRR